jgi:hypothetical protein
MALILVFVNDTTGPDNAANYNVRVLIGDGTEDRSRTIAIGRVEGHPRADGWAALVQRFVRDQAWTQLG